MHRISQVFYVPGCCPRQRFALHSLDASADAPSLCVQERRCLGEISTDLRLRTLGACRQHFARPSEGSLQAGLRRKARSLTGSTRLDEERAFAALRCGAAGGGSDMSFPRPDLVGYASGHWDWWHSSVVSTRRAPLMTGSMNEKTLRYRVASSGRDSRGIVQRE